MVDKSWSSHCHFGQAFTWGLVISFILYWVVRLIILGLRRQGGVSGDAVGLEGVALSESVAAIEQFIFYLAAIAGTQVFDFAVGGWFLLKAVSNYALWEVPKEQASQQRALSSRPVSRRLERRHERQHLSLRR